MQLIKSSWRSLGGIDPTIIADLFYTKLFSDNPALRSLFPKQMNEQYGKLMNMLTAIIARPDQHPMLTPDIAEMGRRHLHYGVKPQHYQLVGAALIWTLEKGLGNDWTAEMKEAWLAYYALLSFIMQQGAETIDQL